MITLRNVNLAKSTGTFVVLYFEDCQGIWKVHLKTGSAQIAIGVFTLPKIGLS